MVNGFYSLTIFANRVMLELTTQELIKLKNAATGCWLFLQKNSIITVWPDCSRTGIYLPKVHNRNTRATCEICSKLTIKTPKRRPWRRNWCLYCCLRTYFTSCSSVSVVKFEQVNAAWAKHSFEIISQLENYDACLFICNSPWKKNMKETLMQIWKICQYLRLHIEILKILH